MVSSDQSALVPSGELSPVAASAAIQHEIQSAIMIARRLPRDEQTVNAKLLNACSRPSFADSAAYEFPRGKTTVTGPSVRFARELARLWGNLRYGVDVTQDTDEVRTLTGWAWDLETNTKIEAQDSFKKLVYRKTDNGGHWIKPDERQLREETNKRAAILERNCILKLTPPDIVEAALEACKKTLTKQTSTSSTREVIGQVVSAFQALNVNQADLEKKLGKPLQKATPAELTDLRLIYKSIADGQSRWSDYVADGPADSQPASGALNVSDLAAGKEDNRGHGKDGLESVGKKK